MKPAQRRQIVQFFARVETRILQETSLAAAPGIRATARQAAAARAAQLSQDLAYLRASYLSHPVMVGEGDAR